MWQGRLPPWHGTVSDAMKHGNQPVFHPTPLPNLDKTKPCFVPGFLPVLEASSACPVPPRLPSPRHVLPPAPDATYIYIYLFTYIYLFIPCLYYFDMYLRQFSQMLNYELFGVCRQEDCGIFLIKGAWLHCGAVDAILTFLTVLANASAVRHFTRSLKCPFQPQPHFLSLCFSLPHIHEVTPGKAKLK